MNTLTFVNEFKKISDVKELARKQFEKEKEEFNGILHVSAVIRQIDAA